MRTLTLLVVLLLVPARALADERWYVFSIGTTPVGWISEQVDGLQTRVTISAKLTRLGKSIEMRFEALTIEDAEGALQTLQYETVLSKQPMRLDVRVDGESVRIGSPPQERVLPRGARRLLGPLGVEKLTAERLRAAGDQIEYAVFSPELQRVATVHRRLVADEVEVCGTTARELEEMVDGLPAPRTVWLDADGRMLGDRTAGPFGPMAACRATKETALAANGTLPADLYERTVARSNFRFADPHAIDRLVVRIRPRSAGNKLPDLAAYNQRAIEPGLVEISRPLRSPNAGAAAPLREFLDANPLVESTNADVVRIARPLVRSEPYETALALAQWTAENLSMDAGIVMAPASELIRDRRATCMGYATLLAALARAVGLPSRVAMGYVYYGGIWGGHAWTEIFIDEQWLPFDAAVYAPGVASATRIAVGASSLADGTGALLGPLMALFGQVDVDVVELDSNGRTTRVDAHSRPYEIRRNTYVNRGLGLRVDAKGWTVDRADSTWPSSLVVAFRRGDTTIELHQRALYPERRLTQMADAVFSRVAGSTLWVWTATGPEAATSLRQFLTRVERVQ